MEEYINKKYIIEAEGEMPFAMRIEDGYELLSNARDMKFLIKKQQIVDLEREINKTHFAVVCLVREGNGWVKGDNSTFVLRITDFVKQINISPYFTKAVGEYRQQNEITETWR